MSARAHMQLRRSQSGAVGNFHTHTNTTDEKIAQLAECSPVHSMHTYQRMRSYATSPMTNNTGCAAALNNKLAEEERRLAGNGHGDEDHNYARCVFISSICYCLISVTSVKIVTIPTKYIYRTERRIVAQRNELDKRSVIFQILYTRLVAGVFFCLCAHKSVYQVLMYRLPSLFASVMAYSVVLR